MERLVIMVPEKVQKAFEKTAMKNRTTMSDALRDLMCDYSGIDKVKVKKGRPKIYGTKSRKTKV